MRAEYVGYSELDTHRLFYPRQKIERERERGGGRGKGTLIHAEFEDERSAAHEVYMRVYKNI